MSRADDTSAPENCPICGSRFNWNPEHKVCNDCANAGMQGVAASYTDEVVATPVSDTCPLCDSDDWDTADQLCYECGYNECDDNEMPLFASPSLKPPGLQ